MGRNGLLAASRGGRRWYQRGMRGDTAAGRIQRGIRYRAARGVVSCLETRPAAELSEGCPTLPLALLIPMQHFFGLDFWGWARWISDELAEDEARASKLSPLPPSLFLVLWPEFGRLWPCGCPGGPCLRYRLTILISKVSGRCASFTALFSVVSGLGRLNRCADSTCRTPEVDDVVLSETAGTTPRPEFPRLCASAERRDWGLGICWKRFGSKTWPSLTMVRTGAIKAVSSQPFSPRSRLEFGRNRAKCGGNDVIWL